MREINVVIVATAVCASMLFADPPDTLWTRTYGGADLENCWAVHQLQDGGYIFGVQTGSFGAGESDIWLVRTDAVGETLWTKVYGDTGRDYVEEVLPTSDGGFIVTSRAEPLRQGNWDVWLLRTDSFGDTLWTRAYGGDSVEDGGNDILQTPDGGFAVAGQTMTFGAGKTDFWLLRTDADGDTLWTRTYGGDQTDIAQSLAATVDGGYALAGYTRSFGSVQNDAYIVRTDSSGDTLWTRAYGGTERDWANSIVTAGDGFVVAGYTASFGAGDENVWLLKLDSDGDTLWTATYGDTTDERAYSITGAADGGFFVVGRMTLGSGESRAYFLHVDSLGNTVWSDTMRGLGDDACYCCEQTSDNGFIVGGRICAISGYSDAWLIRFGPATGVLERTALLSRPAGMPAVVRGVLVLGAVDSRQQTAYRAGLLDVSGRKVLDLKPGANDVRHLSPGVYFIRPAGTVLASQGTAPIRPKVIVTR